VVLARRQTEGRGRADHTWTSPPGGLYLSEIVPLPRTGPQLLPLAVGIELRRALAAEFGVLARVKWPNDLFVENPRGGPAKLAGILIDRGESPSGEPHAVVGVGVNVTTERSALPPEIADRVAILSELTARPVTVEGLEPHVTAAIGSAVDRLDSSDGPPGVIAECRRHLFGVGHPVFVDGAPVGVLDSVEDDGSATVLLDGERSRIRVGDVSPEAAG
ncbi:MAG TPA: biotin--[acetyl-CoA-carboxylase] ligase, partial [Thermoplasmata archaeon]|nr:biotin--[acetyl-CoA-carboxylase] ligase [Thermoplasmata archaeon]